MQEWAIGCPWLFTGSQISLTFDKYLAVFTMKAAGFMVVG